MCVHNGFDSELMVRGLQNAETKSKFVQKVEEQLVLHRVALHDEQELGCPDRGWAHFVDIIRGTAMEWYGKEPHRTKLMLGK